MDAPNELEQLDASLSEMTDLLLSGEAGDGPELEGEYRSPAQGSDARPERPDPAEHQVEQAQAAVAAAMANVAEALEAESSAMETEATGEAQSNAPGSATPGDRGLSAAEPPAEAALAAAAEDLESTRESLSSASADSLHSVTPTVAPAEPADSAMATPERPEESPAPALTASAVPAAGSAIAQPLEAEPTQPDSAPEAESRATPPKLVPKQAAAMIGSGLCSLFAIALEPIGSRLAAAPRAIRHSLAWLAVWTAFNAACVWTYIMLFRAAPPAEGESPAVEIHGAGADHESEKNPELAHEAASEGP